MGNLCPKVSESYSPVEIVDGLFVSEGINHSVLSKLGIRRVLIIGGECNAPGVCLTVSLNDQSDLVAQLERCYEFLDQAATGDKVIFVHCHENKSQRLFLIFTLIITICIQSNHIGHGYWCNTTCSSDYWLPCDSKGYEFRYCPRSIQVQVSFA